MAMADEKRYAANVKYRRGGSEAKELAMYVAAMTDQRQEQAMTKTQQLILQAMRRDVTKREAECLELYFVQGYNYKQIGQVLHISVSTICRNIQRGGWKMSWVLNFARELLETNNGITKEDSND